MRPGVEDPLQWTSWQRGVHLAKFTNAMLQLLYLFRSQSFETYPTYSIDIFAPRESHRKFVLRSIKMTLSRERGLNGYIFFIFAYLDSRKYDPGLYCVIGL